MDEIAGEIRRGTVDAAFELGEAGAEHDPEAGKEDAGEEMEKGGGEPGVAMELEAAREVEHRDAEEGERIPIGERREDGFAPGDLLGEVEVRGEGEGDGRPEEDEDGPAEFGFGFRFGDDGGWLVHWVRGPAIVRWR